MCGRPMRCRRRPPRRRWPGRWRRQRASRSQHRHRHRHRHRQQQRQRHRHRHRQQQRRRSRHRSPYPAGLQRARIMPCPATQAFLTCMKPRRHTTTHRSCWMHSCRSSRARTRRSSMQARRHSARLCSMPCPIPASRPMHLRVMRTASIGMTPMLPPRRYSIPRSTLHPGKTASARPFPTSAQRIKARSLRRCPTRLRRWRRARMSIRIRPPSHLAHTRRAASPM
ncbi:hypothetical protein BTE28158_02883 [Burkholderia territorii]|nr:hypothetical protein BTE28158_02883 [Burkholderia territorii]